MSERMVTNYCERCAELEAEVERLREQSDDYREAARVGHQLADEAEAERDRLRDRLRLFIDAVENYRACHDTLGDGHLETGRAWLGMRRGIDRARKTLAEGDPR